jgi:hypothetical protein
MWAYRELTFKGTEPSSAVGKLPVSPFSAPQRFCEGGTSVNTLATRQDLLASRANFPFVPSICSGP